MILTVTLNASIDKLYLVEKLAPYSVSRVQEVVNTAGGKGLNVSRVAALGGRARHRPWALWAAITASSFKA